MENHPSQNWKWNSKTDFRGMINCDTFLVAPFAINDNLKMGCHIGCFGRKQPQIRIKYSTWQYPSHSNIFLFNQ
jgi:hypothetical protein